MSKAGRILIALVAGLLLGIVGTRLAPGVTADVVAVAEPIGALWLNALQMTIVPLVVALLVTGIATSAEAAKAGRLSARALILFVILLWSSALVAAVVTPLWTDARRGSVAALPPQRTGRRRAAAAVRPVAVAVAAAAG